MKRIFLSLSSVILLLAIILSACIPDDVRESGDEPQKRETNAVDALPNNILKIGDSFEYYPEKAEGHFACTVTDARVVTEESQCPSSEKFEYLLLSANVDGQWVDFEYPGWFVKGGAFDSGCRIVLVDVTVSNIDAEALLNDGTYSPECGFFDDRYAFQAYCIGEMVDLTDIWTTGGIKSYNRYTAVYFSQMGQYSKEDIPETLGHECWAIQILPGQSVNFTLGFFVGTNSDGSRKDLSKLWLCAGSNSRVEDGIFIDLGLGDDEP